MVRSLYVEHPKIINVEVIGETVILCSHVLIWILGVLKASGASNNLKFQRACKGGWRGNYLGPFSRQR